MKDYRSLLAPFVGASLLLFLFGAGALLSRLDRFRTESRALEAEVRLIRAQIALARTELAMPRASAPVAATVVELASIPSRARCPDGFTMHEGVRRDGAYACYGPLEPKGCGEPVGPQIPCKPSVITRGRIRCTGGAVPIVVDARTVGCQMPH